MIGLNSALLASVVLAFAVATWGWLRYRAVQRKILGALDSSDPGARLAGRHVAQLHVGRRGTPKPVELPDQEPVRVEPDAGPHPSVAAAVVSDAPPAQREVPTARQVAEPHIRTTVGPATATPAAATPAVTAPTVTAPAATSMPATGAGASTDADRINDRLHALRCRVDRVRLRSDAAQAIREQGRTPAATRTPTGIRVIAGGAVSESARTPRRGDEGSDAFERWQAASTDEPSTDRLEPLAVGTFASASVHARQAAETFFSGPEPIADPRWAS